MVIEFLKISGGGCLVVFAIFATGTANAKIQTVGTPDPATTEQAIIRQEQPGKFYQIGGGIVSLASGLVLISSGAWNALKGKEPESVVDYLEQHATPAPREQKQEVQLVHREPGGGFRPADLAPEPHKIDKIDVEDNEDNSELANVQSIVPPPPTTPLITTTTSSQSSDNYSHSDNDYKQHINAAQYLQQEIFPEVNKLAHEANIPASFDKYQALRDLVHENSVGIVGYEKGSGKTSKLAYLMAEHIKLGHRVEMVNPLAIGKHWKGLKVWGRGGNFTDAAIGIQRFTNIMKNRLHKRGNPNLDYDPFDEEHFCLVLDELSNYGAKIDEVDKTVMPEFWEINTQYLRQANGSVVFASHGKTQAMLGGAKALEGKSETIQKGIIWLFAQAATDSSIKGGKRCAGWAHLQKPSSEEDGDGRLKKEKILIPSWAQAPNPEFDFRALIQKHCPQYLFNVDRNEEKSNRMPDARDKSPREFKEELQDYWKNVDRNEEEE